MVRGNKPPGADFVIDDTDDTGLSLELGDIPDGLAQGQVVGTYRFADYLTADQELNGGLAGMVTARDEKAESGVREFHLGRGQRTGSGVAAVAGADERVAAVVTELAIDAVDLARDRREAEAAASGLPAVEAVPFEGFDDLGVRLQGSGPKAKGERGKQR